MRQGGRAVPGTRRPAAFGTVPLARALSKRGLASRAEAIALILAGRVRVAGRLDLASTGLLVCTNDTRLAAWLTDPASAVEKEYVVTVRGELDAATVARLVEGVRDDGEWLRPRSMTLLKASARESHVAVVLREGKNREIRRLLAAADREVTRLLRVRVGGLRLGDLAPGAWRDIRRENIDAYFPEYSEGRSRRPRRTDPAY